jgi:alanine racemase
MARPTHVVIDQAALLHNLAQVKRYAPSCKVLAMVKANAYGCGLASVVPLLESGVDAFGVACMEEALAIRALGVLRDCVLIQGVFSEKDYALALEQHFQCVLHEPRQLTWLLDSPLAGKIKIWVKVNTGMNRLGFMPDEIYDVLSALQTCAWVEKDVGLLTHFACADDPTHPANRHQLRLFSELNLPDMTLIKSLANSAAIMNFPEAHADIVRPGIMLYGISPNAHRSGQELGLQPVMQFVSGITAIHHYPSGMPIGYGGTWLTRKPSVIGVVAAGYGDGYPRHISENTPVWVNGQMAPIVGRISMDMLTIDLSDVPGAAVGNAVELWGQHIPVEIVARSAGTIAYELLCQFVRRAPFQSATVLDNF